MLYRQEDAKEFTVKRRVLDLHGRELLGEESQWMTVNAEGDGRKGVYVGKGIPIVSSSNVQLTVIPTGALTSIRLGNHV